MKKQKTYPEGVGESAKTDSSEEVKKLSTAFGNTCLTSGLQRYLSNYVTTVFSKQHEHYKKEFKAEYYEYQALYTKMLTLSSIFINLDSERKHLPPNSKEY